MPLSIAALISYPMAWSIGSSKCINFWKYDYNDEYVV